MKRKETENSKEGIKMKGSISSKLAYTGAGIGLALYAIFGLLYGSLLGGIVGLNIVHALFGTSLAQAVLPRIIVALGMLAGVMVAGTIFVIGSASLGWVIGFVIDPATWRGKETLKEQKIKH